MAAHRVFDAEMQRQINQIELTKDVMQRLVKYLREGPSPLTYGGSIDLNPDSTVVLNVKFAMTTDMLKAMTDATV